MPRFRTQTVQNHREGVRDVKWGWDAIGVVCAVVIAVVGGASTVVAQLSKLETAVTDLRGEFDKRVAESVKIHEGFVPRKEYEAHNHSGAVPKEGR